MRSSRTKTLTAAVALGVLGYAAARAMRPRYSFTDRVVLITGGSRGLGLVMARQLAAEGAGLALLARDEQELERARADVEAHAASYGNFAAEVLTIHCDVTQRSQVDRAVAQTMDRFGRVDVLINNAGMIQVGPLDHLTERDFRDAVDLHMFAPLFTTLAVRPLMQRQGGGRIVNISSIGGKIATPHLLPYSASKFGLVGLSDGLRAELRSDNIFVTTVCPGLMRTGSPPNALFKGQHRKEYAWFTIGDAMPGLSMSADKAARRILDACRDGRARLILGLPAKLAVALNELCPQTTARLSALAAGLLPAPASDSAAGARTRTGWESQSAAAPSLMTVLSDRATRRNNEIRAAGAAATTAGAPGQRVTGIDAHDYE